MIRINSRIPFIIHPLAFAVLFFIIALIIFPISLKLESFYQILAMYVVSVVSILFHELGHSGVAYLFGANPVITVSPLFAATIYSPSQLSSWKQILITLAGPMVSVAIFFVSGFLFLNVSNSMLFASFYFVNLIYMTSLIPMLPMDGGHLVRILLEKSFGSKGLRATFAISIFVACAILFLIFVTARNLFSTPYLIAIIYLSIFAIQNVQLLISSKQLHDSDRSEENKALLLKAEIYMQQGDVGGAKAALEEMLQRCKEGQLHIIATEYLAIIAYDEKQVDQAYKLLISLNDSISDNSANILHTIASDRKDYSTVRRLSARCFKNTPSEIIALNNARAFGANNEPEKAGGWLHRACKFNNIKLEDIIKEEEFSKVKENAEFLSFFNKQ